MWVADQCAVVVVEGMRGRTALELVGSSDARARHSLAVAALNKVAARIRL